MELIDDLYHLSVGELLLLALIRQGIDHRQPLVQVSGLPERRVYRYIDQLMGKTRYQGGKLVGGGLPLITSRKHPHEQGFQLVITSDGEQALQRVTAALGSNAHT